RISRRTGWKVYARYRRNHVFHMYLVSRGVLHTRAYVVGAPLTPHRAGEPERSVVAGTTPIVPSAEVLRRRLPAPPCLGTRPPEAHGRDRCGALRPQPAVDPAAADGLPRRKRLRVLRRER